MATICKIIFLLCWDNNCGFNLMPEMTRFLSLHFSEFALDLCFNVLPTLTAPLVVEIEN